MKGYDLHQTLVLDPSLGFERIASALEELGWQRADPGPATPTAISGEPELATWTWGGAKPFCVYSLNPVVRLRVLDLSTCPPPLRASIAERLPCLGAPDLAKLLDSAEPRSRLLALWAIGELERIDLAQAASGLLRDPEPLVARAAAELRDRLEALVQGRLGSLGALRLIAQSAEPLIRSLGDPQVAAGLVPGVDDCFALFDPAAAKAVAEGVAALYKSPPRADPGDLYPELKVTALGAGLLRWPNELSDRFPQGYRDIAGWMDPHRVWLAWAWETEPGHSPKGAVRYDGLAWLDGRWVWIPKPYRLLAPMLKGLSSPPNRVLH